MDMETVTLDARGRLTLPREMRERLNLRPGDRVAVELADRALRITRALPTNRAERAAWFAEALAEDNAYLEAHPEEVEALRAEAAAWDGTLLDGLRDEPPYDDPRAREVTRGTTTG
jgi:AbrB family looped-hinge helix DNA binding protein